MNQAKHTLNDKIIFFGSCLILFFVLYAFITQHDLDWLSIVVLIGMAIICIVVIVLFILRK